MTERRRTQAKFALASHESYSQTLYMSTVIPIRAIDTMKLLIGMKSFMLGVAVTSQRSDSIDRKQSVRQRPGTHLVTICGPSGLRAILKSQKPSSAFRRYPSRSSRAMRTTLTTTPLRFHSMDSAKRSGR